MVNIRERPIPILVAECVHQIEADFGGHSLGHLKRPRQPQVPLLIALHANSVAAERALSCLVKIGWHDGREDGGVEGKAPRHFASVRHGERADFLPTAAGALKSLLTFMQQNPTVKIEIEGHVNGPNKSNTKAFKKLSFDRAYAVKKYLVENGIESNRMQYIGYGNSQMLYPYPMKEVEHSANRRVEVKIIAK